MCKINKLNLKLDKKLLKLKRKYNIKATENGSGFIEIELIDYKGSFLICTRGVKEIKSALRNINKWIKVIILEYYYGKEKPLN